MWSSFRKAKCYVNVRTYRIGSGGRLGAQKTSSFSLATSKEFWEVHSASAWLQEKLLSSCSIPSSPVRWNLLMDSPFLVWFLFKEWKKKKKELSLLTFFPLIFFPFWKRDTFCVLFKFLSGPAEHLGGVSEKIKPDCWALKTSVDWAEDYLGHSSVTPLQVSRNPGPCTALG